MSSSSTSSSSSSSLEYSSSSSSSSSVCCINPFCYGSYCSGLTSWILYGLHSFNTDGCGLYVVFDNFSGYQQIELFKDYRKRSIDLVAIGQSNISGVIGLLERNNSGIYGEVTWDGNIISFPNELYLTCFELSSESSSSSTSSIDSKSSLSTSSSYTSSSSSGCCQNYVCDGNDCASFSAWTVYGANKNNTDNCSLYASFDFVSPGEQEIRLYNLPSRTSDSLVAAGQDSTTYIVLSQRNSSGISATVLWNGPAIYAPSYATLDCEVSSSSSSSSSSNSSSSFSSDSSSSLSSSSSSSSSSSDSSSSYSLSSQSRSSASTSSTSSSSSIDSSSSSSESVGNVSTSSSSSFGGWNKTKPLILGMSAVNSNIISNRLAQTIKLIDTTYTIGKVYCYFYGPYGYNSNYTIHLDIYNCNDDGSPSSFISGQTLDGSSIISSDWYSFEFNIDNPTPSNRYISFVLWQENGDEDNYVLWGYSFSDVMDSKAWISNDAINWEEHTGAVRAIKAVGNFNAYDLSDYKIVSPPSELFVSEGNFDNGTYNGTKFVKGSYQYDSDKVVIDNPPLLTSFIIDSSGSMGWNDRFDSRKEFVQKFIQKVKSNYPSESLFDIIKVGSLVANASSIASQLGTPTTIKIDLNQPTRSSYGFTVFDASASKGDVYSTNNVFFTVSQDITDANYLIASGDGSIVPPLSGILTKIYGSGDSEIQYTSNFKATISDQIVAYGFKNLEDGHSYNVGEINIGGAFSGEVSLLNWQPIEPDASISLSIGSNGPNDSDTLDFIAEKTMVLRKPLSLQDLQTTQLSSDALVGSNLIGVQSSSITSINQRVDIFDKDIASLNHLVTNSSSTTLSLYEIINYNISKWSDNGGSVQQAVDLPVNVKTTTAELLVRDIASTRNITFFFQTSSGLSIEWDFQAFSEWYIYNLFWNDETALIPVTLMDEDGNPFPDGTEVAFYVDNKPDTTVEIQAQIFSKDATIGDIIVYLSDTTGYKIDDEIDIVNSENLVQTTTIIEVGSDNIGNYIKIEDPLIRDYTVSENSKIILHMSILEAANVTSDGFDSSNLLSSSLGIVDATPIYVGKSLDPSLLKPYDPPPISPTASYEDLLTDELRIRPTIIDAPTIDGKIFIQILPITEDNLKTSKEKEEESNKLIRTYKPDTYSSQLQQNEDDPTEIESDIENSTSVFTSTTTTMIGDYTIDSPVYLRSGLAQASMTTKTVAYEELTLDGFNIPGVNSNVSNVMLIRDYNIYPAIVLRNEINNSEIAKQYLNSIQVYFTPSVWVFSNCSSSVPVNIEYRDAKYPNGDTECACNCSDYGVRTASLGGVYAGSNEPIIIDYTVAYRGTLANNMKLNVKIYSNINFHSEYNAENTNYAPTKQYFNYGLPKSSKTVNSQTVIYQPLTEISNWRNIVDNNPLNETTPDMNGEVDPSVSEYNLYVSNKYKLQNEIAEVGGMISATSLARSAVSGASGISEEGIDIGGGYVLDCGSYAEATSLIDLNFYDNPTEWNNAVQLGDYKEQTIDIINGKARLTIPPSDVCACLFVEASVYYGDDNTLETIRADYVAFVNPINFGSLTPDKIMSVAGSEKYEIGIKDIKWYDGVIPSNVTVLIEPYETSVAINKSKTDSLGSAGGIEIGPHVSVDMTCFPGSSCPCYGSREGVRVTINYLQYTKIDYRHIHWIGSVNNGEEPDKDGTEFYFIVDNGSDFAWADSVENYNTLFSDLGTDLNKYWIDEYGSPPSDGRKRMGCGEDQIEENPPYSSTKISTYCRSLKVEQDSERWQPVDCVAAEIKSTYSSRVYGINQNIGVMPTPKDSDSPFMSRPPWIQNVRVYSGYRYEISETKIRKQRYGIGSTGNGPYWTINSQGDSEWIVPLPIVKLVEPLGTSISIESYNSQFLRNGNDSPEIVVSVTWKGEPVTNWYTKPDGTRIEFSFPQVGFEVGDVLESNLIRDNPEDPPVAKDERGSPYDALSIKPNSKFSMSSYSVTATLSRTDINSSESSTHTHTCSVDKNGDGITNGTIVLSGEFVDHEHVISNYVAEVSAGSPNEHIHKLRCVAVSKLNPTTDTRSTVVVNGYAYYDPTGCDPYQPLSRGSSSAGSLGTTYGNRMMFSTLYLDNTIKDKELVFNITAPDVAWTSKITTDESKAINILVEASFSDYTVEDYPGHWITIPSAPVPDGTRIILEMNTYRSPIKVSSNNSDILIISPDEVRDYMIISVNASAEVDGYKGFENHKIEVRSALQWLPGVQSLFTEPTNDDIYVSEALSKINSIGGSPIHDGVQMAAQRIIDFQTTNSVWKGYKKIIFLLTDADENMSQYSIYQAIDNVNFIDGKCEVPLTPIRIGRTYASDDVLLSKYSLDTCGENRYMYNPSTSDVDLMIGDIVTSNSMPINNGTYLNTIDLGNSNLPHRVYMSNFILPIGSRILFRVRSSKDGKSWVGWSEWYDSSNGIDFDLNIDVIGRYFQYEVKLFGNENFESPTLYLGASVEYYKSQDFTIFFQPVDLNINSDQYLASIHITHQADIPSTSVINYGFSQFDSVEKSDYYGVTRPLIEPDRHTILLSRYKELFLTDDYLTYTAINGGWPKNATTEVYMVNNSSIMGELISPTDYAINSRDGKVTFYNIRNKNDTFVLCLYFDSVFRIICNITNYGPTPAEIDHIGIMYNITKRK